MIAEIDVRDLYDIIKVFNWDELYSQPDHKAINA